MELKWFIDLEQVLLLGEGIHFCLAALLVRSRIRHGGILRHHELRLGCLKEPTVEGHCYLLKRLFLHMLVCLLLHAILFSFRSAEVGLIGGAGPLGDNRMLWRLQARVSRFSTHLRLLILNHLFISVCDHSKGQWSLRNVHIPCWHNLFLVKVVQWGHHASWLCLGHLCCRLALDLSEGEILRALLWLWSLVLIGRGWSIIIAQRRLAWIGDSLCYHSRTGGLLLLTWGKKVHRLLLIAAAGSVFRGTSRSWYEFRSHRIHTLIAVIWGIIEGSFGLRFTNR